MNISGSIKEFNQNLQAISLLQTNDKRLKEKLNNKLADILGHLKTVIQKNPTQASSSLKAVQMNIVSIQTKLQKVHKEINIEKYQKKCEYFKIIVLLDRDKAELLIPLNAITPLKVLNQNLQKAKESEEYIIEYPFKRSIMQLILNPNLSETLTSEVLKGLDVKDIIEIVKAADYLGLDLSLCEEKIAAFFLNSYSLDKIKELAIGFNLPASFITKLVNKVDFNSENALDFLKELDEKSMIDRLKLKNQQIETFLPHLKNIKSLCLEGCGKALPRLEHLSSLKQLTVRGPQLKFTSSTILSNPFEFLENLKKKGTTEDFGSLNTIAGLECLEIDNMNLTKLSIDNLLNLKICKFINCQELKEFPSFHSFVKLEELEMDCVGFTDLSNIEKLTSLQFLTIKSCNYAKRLSLKGLIDLKTLEIDGAVNLESLPSFDDLKSLESLTIRMCDIHELPSFRAQIKLKTLIISSLGEGLKVLSDFHFLSNLKNLEIGAISNLTFIYSLDQLTKLRKLHIIQCKNLIEYPDLDKLINLEECNIDPDGEVPTSNYYIF